MSLPIFPSVVRGFTWPAPKASNFSTIVQSAPNNLEMTVSQARNPRWTWQFVYGYLKDYDIQAGQTYTDYRIFADFLLSLQGSGGEFLFLDPFDNNLGPNNTNVQAQLQLITDGAGHWYSPIQRNFGGTFYEDITDLNGSIAVYANGVLKAPGPTADYQIVGPGLAIPGNSFMGLVVAWNLPTGVGTWGPGISYILGAEILDPAGHIQKVTTAGTSGASIPTFNDLGGTTPDGTGSLVWTDQGANAPPATPITAQASFYFRCRMASDSATIDQFMQQIWTYGGTESSSGEPLTFKTSPPVQV